MSLRALPLRLLWLLALAALFSSFTKAQNVSPHQIVQGFPATAAGINSEDTYLGSNAGTIKVITPGSYCDTTVLLSAKHTLQFAPGTYQINIQGADSSSANLTWGVDGQAPNTVTLQGCPAVSKPVITSQNFGSFTGGSNFYGVFQPFIRNLTIDCNSVATYGIQLYARSPILDGTIRTINCVNDGQYWEWGGTESDTSAGTTVNGNGVILESDYNSGNGFTFKTTGSSPGSVNAAANIVAHNNSGWGIQQYYSISVGQINSYNNTSGGCDMKGGSLIATNVECDTTTGWGLLQEAAAGSIFIGGGVITGGIPFESRTTSGGFITSDFSSASGSNPCIKINGGGSLLINGYAFGCNTAVVAFTSELTPSIISITYAGNPTNYTGTPLVKDYINIQTSGGSQYSQLPNVGLGIGAGANGVSSGTVTLSGGAGSHTFTTPYASAPNCTASDGTATNAVKVTSSTSAVTLAGTSSDVVTWICTVGAN